MEKEDVSEFQENELTRLDVHKSKTGDIKLIWVEQLPSILLLIDVSFVKVPVTVVVHQVSRGEGKRGTLLKTFDVVTVTPIGEESLREWGDEQFYDG